MKKQLFCIALVMSLLLSACSGTEEPAAPSAPASPADATAQAPEAEAPSATRHTSARQLKGR